MFFIAKPFEVRIFGILISFIRIHKKMSNKIAIKVEGLSKEYQIGQNQSDNLRGAFSQFLGGMKKRKTDTFFALKDLDFEVKEGETLGIIGGNGAGKSTLLKNISRITEPSAGRIEINGRISALLEVGTGFHMELTGRENVFLNGTILGMSREEVRTKFDEIVAFSGVEKFIDTPVKHYSSGMLVRLAFSVAAHLEPEILIVDEVLAVGDVDFQRKCFQKMGEVGQSGRTVLVVSHNMDAIERLCDRTIVLKEGQICFDGEVSEGIKTYNSVSKSADSYRNWSLEDAPGNEIVKLIGISAQTEEGEKLRNFDIRKPIIIEFEYQVLKSGEKMFPGFHMTNEQDVVVFITGDFQEREWANTPREKGVYKSKCVIPANLLAEGKFAIDAIINTRPIFSAPYVNHVQERGAISFAVYDTVEGDSARGQHRGPYFGVVRPILKWKTQKK
ncbi:MAG: lipopolysaccharide transport system ATP-binding protein [Arenicella sp.]